MTHTIIRSKFIRSVYAAELFYSRRLIRTMGAGERWAYKLALESAFWGMQKRLA